jgi:putative transport protein
MDFILDLFWGDSAAHTVFIISLTVFLGVLLGKIRVFGISAGIGGVLFSGLLIGHFKMGFSADVMEFVKEFGLILFVYSIGIQVGPAFFASFKKQGIKLNLIASAIVFMNLSVAAVIFFLLKLPVAVLVGILSGAVTNTPGLGAAQQVLREVMPDNPEMYRYPGLGYAMAYPFGIFGIILTMLLIKRVFEIKMDKEKSDFESEKGKNYGNPLEYSIIITKPGATGKTIEKIKSFIDGDFVISQIMRNGESFIPSPESELQQSDLIQVVCRPAQFDDLVLLLGDVSEFDFRNNPARMNSVAINVTRKDAQKSLGELDLNGRYGINLIKLERSGLEMICSPSVKLCLGDTVTAVGPEDGLEKASALLGNSERDLDHPEIIPLFLGILAGILIGSVPLYIPGLSVPVKLGIAGGPLLAAVVLGRVRRIGPLNWHLPAGANLMIREIGITLFLACVGIKSGAGFLDSLISGQGFLWMGAGVFITALPLLTAAFILRGLLKMNYLTLSGLLAGSCTDPPALSFACDACGSDSPVVSYATVYALTMFLRIITAQLFVIILAG